MTKLSSLLNESKPYLETKELYSIDPADTVYMVNLSDSTTLIERPIVTPVHFELRSYQWYATPVGATAGKRLMDNSFKIFRNESDAKAYVNELLDSEIKKATEVIDRWTKLYNQFKSWKQ